MPRRHAVRHRRLDRDGVGWRSRCGWWDLIVNRGLSAEIFAYLAVLILPRFLDIVLPIGVFIAVLFVFNRLTSEASWWSCAPPGLGR